jgi:hypothetical protein
MLKIESIEGEPQVTTDPLVAKHVSTMFLDLFIAYKQEMESKFVLCLFFF